MVITRWERLSLLLTVLALVAVFPGTVEAGPRARAQIPANELVFDSDRSGNYEIYRMAPDGSGTRRLTSDARYDSWWPQVSPDRTRLLFYRTPKGVHDRDFTKTSLWAMNADGTGTARLIATGANNWTYQGHADWSPDGRRIVMFAGPAGLARSPQIFTTNADGTSPFQVTNRPGPNLDPSWSPDGSSVLFIGCPAAPCDPESYEVYRIASDGTRVTRLTDDAVRDHDPYYSPDGSQVAWLRQTGIPNRWAIFSMRADGSGRRAVIDDGSMNSKPAWSVDSTRIYFHRWPLGSTLFSIWRINSDGSGLVAIHPRAPGPGPYNDEFPAHV